MATAKKKKPVSASQKYSNAVSKMEYDKKVSGAYRYKNDLASKLEPKGDVFSKEYRRKLLSNEAVRSSLYNLLVADMVRMPGMNKKGTGLIKGFNTKNTKATTYGQGKKSQTNVAVINADRARGLISGQASLKRKRGGGVAE